MVHRKPLRGMPRGEPFEPGKLTICQVLSILYCSAVVRQYEGDEALLRIAFIMAKKMNRRLMEYKHGHLPSIPNNSWLEADWHAELNKIKEKTLMQVNSKTEISTGG